MKIRSVRDEILHADRRTDMRKLIFAFRSFANGSKNIISLYNIKCLVLITQMQCVYSEVRLKLLRD